MLIFFQLPFYIAPGAVLKTELGTFGKDVYHNVRDTVIDAGVSKKDAQRAMKKAYRYFHDTLKIKINN